MKRQLALLILVETLLAVGAQAQEGGGASQPTLNSALPQLRLEALSATRDRPLFAQDRRPLPPPARPAVVTNVPQRKQAPILRGVILSSIPAIALLEDTATAEPIVVTSGGVFGPWKIIVESAHTVALVEGDKKIILNLFDQ